MLGVLIGPEIKEETALAENEVPTVRRNEEQTETKSGQTVHANDSTEANEEVGGIAREIEMIVVTEVTGVIALTDGEIDHETGVKIGEEETAAETEEIAREKETDPGTGIGRATESVDLAHRDRADVENERSHKKNKREKGTESELMSVI